MTEMLPAQQLAGTSLEQVLIGGDLSKLTSADRVMYYKAVCESVGLNPLTKPFEYITLNSKLTLYARRDATDQLRQIHKVSIEIVAREVVEDCYVVTARATTPIRQDESIGVVNIAGLKGDVRANAMMKAETKAKRRVTLSICGLGMLDETEVDSIPGARITPSAGVEEQLTREETIRVDEVVANMQEWIAQGSIGDAVYEMENAALNAEQQIVLWTRFDSKQRSAMKREQAKIKAAAQESGTQRARLGTTPDSASLTAPTAPDNAAPQDPEKPKSSGGLTPPPAGVAPASKQERYEELISDSARKRLEARISELKIDREQVKQYIGLAFGRAHFSELTKEEYRVVDSFVEIIGATTLDELAGFWKGLSKDDRITLTAAKNARKAALETQQPAGEV